MSAADSPPRGLAPCAEPLVPWRIAAALRPLGGAQVQVGGCLGARMRTNVEQRLLAVDEALMLDHFRHRTPSSDFANAWVGEHAGKFLAAACRSLESADHAALRAKMVRVADRLVAAQDADGYLGTYVDADRWTGWDMWVHKYVLIGLLAVHRLTGDPGALAACRGIGDLVERDFGGPGGGDRLNASGWFFGMAATSILEPLCDLYRRTAEARYLALAETVAAAWEAPGGARIVSALHDGGIEALPSGKAYEFLSNLNGLLDLYRLTGRAELLAAARIAWSDIRDTQLYPTGSLSAMEHFQPAGRLRALPASNLAETCVTVTWLQFNARLFHLTGEARFGAECERAIFNHLLAAQDPDNGDFCYYTALCGTKEFSSYPLCCVSSGPRAIAALPDHVWAEGAHGLTLNILADSRIACRIGDTEVAVEVTSGFPDSLDAEIVIAPRAATRFALHIRVPDWATQFVVDQDGQAIEGSPGTMLAIDRQWRPGDRLTVHARCRAELIEPSARYPGRALIRYGPQMLTVAAEANPGLDRLDEVRIAPDAVAALAPGPGDGPAHDFPVCAVLDRAGSASPRPVTAQLRPFARARRHMMLIRTAGRDAASSATLWARAYGSHTHLHPGIAGPQPMGSPFVGEFVTDGRVDTAATLDLTGLDSAAFRSGTASEPGHCWVMLVFDRPLMIGRIRFRHGTGDRTQWFAAPPRLAVSEAPVPIATVDPTVQACWDDVGTLPRYTTAAAAGGDDPRFELCLPRPRACRGIRIAGVARTRRLGVGELSGDG